jgi:hypothetical protein
MKTLPYPSRVRTRGQALVKFALILPVLLMILMVLIEIARLFSAWLIVENVTREAARYAITGQFDPQYCQPDTSKCDTGSKNYDDAVFNVARTKTIHDVSQGAAAGILVDFNNTTQDSRSYYHLLICSSRDVFFNTPVGHESCVMPDGTEGDDAGGPGDTVIMIATFDHPLITPLRAIADWVPLLSQRQMVNEEYRRVRLQGLPPPLILTDSVVGASKPPLEGKNRAFLGNYP